MNYKITIIKDKNNENLEEEKLLREEITNLKYKNINYENEITKLKTDNNKLEKELLLNKIEERQFKVVEYYLRKEKTKEFNNNSCYLKALLFKEINDKVGLYLDSN